VTWFFAILLVLAMGGVAVVASGRGGSLPEEYDDRPDVRVPATGPLTGDDVRGVRFSLAFRGYRMSEVDALLARLAAQVDDARHAEDDPRDPSPRADDAARGDTDRT
jgi:DivIVA domain-containing protein